MALKNRAAIGTTYSAAADDKRIIPLENIGKKSSFWATPLSTMSEQELAASNAKHTRAIQAQMAKYQKL